MASIEEAKVRDEILPIEPVKYSISSSVALPCHAKAISNTFSDVIESRTSRRVFSNIPLEQLGPLFYLSNRTKQSTINKSGLAIEKRNAPSCGAMHTIDCIVSQFGSSSWYVYNSRGHTFDGLDISTSTINQFKLECQELIDCPDHAYLIWYVCDIERLSSKYENAEFLALREAGALASTQGLVAESYGLSFCMLGLMGCEQAKSLSNQRNLLGVGVSVVGGLPNFI